MAIKAVFFDVGETLIDETRYWALWADLLGVPHLTFFAALGATIQQGRHHRDVFKYFGTDYESVTERATPGANVGDFRWRPSDFYPDVLPCLRALKSDRRVIGVAGNQPDGWEEALMELGFAADIRASLAAWGVEKPHPEFFERVEDAVAAAPGEIAYVGDRFDNDIEPAHRAGLVPIFIKRGPWGVIQDAQQRNRCEAAAIDSLAELPDTISQL